MSDLAGRAVENAEFIESAVCQSPVGSERHRAPWHGEMVRWARIGLVSDRASVRDVGKR